MSRALRLVRRAVACLLLLLFVGLSAWWCVYFPFDRERIYRAIPPNYVLLSRHDALASRWKAAAHHPPLRALWAAAGGTAADLDALASDPGTDAFLHNVAARHTAIAYVPALGTSARPAWVFSTWLGPYANLMRWGLLRGGLEGFAKHREPDGVVVWSAPCADRRWGGFLSLAVVEGVLVGSAGDDPAGAAHLARRISMGAVVVPELTRGDPTPPTADEGWLQVAPLFGRTPIRTPVHFGFTELSAGQSAGWAQAVVAGWPPGVLADVRALADVPLRAPAAVAVVPFGTLRSLGQGPDVPRGVRLAVARLAREIGDESPAFLSLHGGERSGRILGLRTPSLLVGARAKGPFDRLAAVSEILDGLNSHYRWSLIPREGEPPVRAVVVETSKGGLYGSMKTAERPALAACGAWLLAGTCLSALEATITEDRPGTLSRLVADCAARDGIPAESAGGLIRIDTAQADEALQNALAVYGLAIRVLDGEGGADTRDTLDVVRRVLAALKPLGTATLWLRPRGSELRIDFRFAPGAGTRRDG